MRVRVREHNCPEGDWQNGAITIGFRPDWDWCFIVHTDDEIAVPIAFCPFCGAELENLPSDGAIENQGGRMGFDYDVILTGVEDNIDELNEALKILGFSGFHKAGDICVYAMHGRNLPVSWIVDAVSATEWRDAQGVQMFVRTDHNYRFMALPLEPLEAPRFAWFTRGEPGNFVWSFERKRERLPSLIAATEQQFSQTCELTMLAIIAARLGKLEEFNAWMTDEDRATLFGLAVKDD